MRHAIAAVILVLGACTTEASPPTTGAGPATSAILTTTTTTAPTMEIRDGGRALTDLIVGLYSGKPVEAPRRLIDAFASSDGSMPAHARASIAKWGKTRLAVVETGNDVTLAVADPDWRVVGGWWPSIKVKADLGRFPKLIAVVGSDARPGEPRETSRSDSIHFLAIDGKGTAALVGLPRDSWVPIPGHGTTKVNAALSYGGPELMMSTFSNLTGLHFDGYVLTGFAGFEELIGVIGGLMIDVPRTFADQAAHAFIEAGLQLLSPKQALGLSRARKTLPGGDFARQANGGLVLMAAQAMVEEMGALALPDILANSHPWISTDLEPDRLLVLSAAILRVNPNRVTNVVAPGSAGSAGSASVVYLHASAADLWADLADGRLETSD